MPVCKAAYLFDVPKYLYKQIQLLQDKKCSRMLKYPDIFWVCPTFKKPVVFWLFVSITQLLFRLSLDWLFKVLIPQKIKFYFLMTYVFCPSVHTYIQYIHAPFTFISQAYLLHGNIVSASYFLLTRDSCFSACAGSSLITGADWWIIHTQYTFATRLSLCYQIQCCLSNIEYNIINYKSYRIEREVCLGGLGRKECLHVSHCNVKCKRPKRAIFDLVPHATTSYSWHDTCQVTPKMKSRIPYLSHKSNKAEEAVIAIRRNIHGICLNRKEKKHQRRTTVHPQFFLPILLIYKMY